MTSPTTAPSYGALLRVPGMRGLLASMTLARTAQAMAGMTLTLLVLALFDSPALAGVVAFASIVPGLVVSPIAGALLDRHGRVRLVTLDYLVAALALGAVALLASAGALSAPVLVAIAAASSLTVPLSNSGLRSLFPRVVPPHLWERANAIDSAGWVVAGLIGPPIAGFAVAAFGAPTALGCIAVVFVAAAASARAVFDPPSDIATSGRLLTDALDGLAYFWRNRTLRALGLAIGLANITWGTLGIVVPVVTLGRLGGDPALVGWLFAGEGVGGLVAALAFGRMDSSGRERRWLVASLLATAAVLGLLLVPGAGVWAVASTLILVGLLNGPLDIAMFTLRQRRTDPAWIGRAFAVSMSVNWVGSPVGSAVSGSLVATSIALPVVVAIVCSLAAAAAAWWLIPQTDDPGSNSLRVRG